MQITDEPEATRPGLVEELMVHAFGLLRLLLAIALDERPELLGVGLALRRQGVAGVVDVGLFGETS
jgi:hypothetical protein